MLPLAGGPPQRALRFGCLQRTRMCSHKVTVACLMCHAGRCPYVKSFIRREKYATQKRTTHPFANDSNHPTALTVLPLPPKSCSSGLVNAGLSEGMHQLMIRIAYPHTWGRCWSAPCIPLEARTRRKRPWTPCGTTPAPRCPRKVGPYPSAPAQTIKRAPIISRHITKELHKINHRVQTRMPSGTNSYLRARSLS